MEKIYLACPYSHDDENIRLKRFKLANEIAARIMSQGHIVFSPISHSHPIAVRSELPLGFDFWDKFDRSFIEWCDELWVLCIDGWSDSVGVITEIKIAIGLGKTVRPVNL